MDEYTTKYLADVSTQLLKSSYSWIISKREIARNAQTLEDQREKYEEIIDQLLEEENNSKSVALHYKELYENVSIKDEDIEYLRETIERVFTIINDYKDENKSEEEGLSARQGIDAFLDLIHVDTLKTMQLLGFKYKDAIGKPLTDVCADFIYTKLGGNNQSYKPNA
ncbi:hypothetical protein [Oceanobacillus jeddahense]|uniref:hypothetical protein n=1 Tax=Oceanobacillus jeddahense TaxID=1462527 RepID=UPI000693559F|nr:hypothetical protein [Oceanobacillus jeddahense]